MQDFILYFAKILESAVIKDISSGCEKKNLFFSSLFSLGSSAGVICLVRSQACDNVNM